MCGNWFSNPIGTAEKKISNIIADPWSTIGTIGGAIIGGPWGAAAGNALGNVASQGPNGFVNNIGSNALNAAGAYGGTALTSGVGNSFSSAFPETSASIGSAVDSATPSFLQGAGSSVSNGISDLYNGSALQSGVNGISNGISSSYNSLPSTGIGSLLSNGYNSASNALGFSPSVNATTPSGFTTLDGSASTAMPSTLPSLTAGAGTGGLAGTGAASAGIGGGASSYGGLGTLLSVGGAANSLLANKQAQKDLVNSQNNAIGALDPYLNSGKAANSALGNALGTSGNSSSAGYGSLTQPFTPTDLTNDPGYQFQLQQGNQALDRQQAAKGDYFSGAALKAAQDYGQGLAGTTFNNAFQRNLSTNQNIYNDLAGQAGVGASAANNAGNIYGNIGSAQANAGINSANITNQALSALLSGSGAKKPVNIGGQVVYI